jgi:putative aminopeptidase FrvX
VVFGVPVRHVHAHVGLFSLADAESCVRLVVEMLKRLDKGTVEGFTRL